MASTLRSGKKRRAPNGDEGHTRAKRRSVKPTKVEILSKSRSYTRFEFATWQKIERLEALNEDNYATVLRLHSLTSQHGFTTKRMTPGCLKGCFYARVVRRPSKTSKKSSAWKPVTASTLLQSGRLRTTFFSCLQAADHAALAYRFWSDVDFRVAVICELNPDARQHLLDKGRMLEELENEQYKSKFECLVAYRDCLHEGFKILDGALCERTTDDLVEKPDKIALSPKESEIATIKCEILRRFCELKIKAVEEDLTCHIEKETSHRSKSTQSILCQIHDEFALRRGKRSVVTIRQYVKRFFEVDEEKGSYKFSLSRDGRGRVSKSSLLFNTDVAAQLKNWTRQELRTLSCETAREFINNHILKKKKGDGEYVFSDELLEESKIDPVKREISLQCAHRWITHHSIGCHQKYRSQSYYVDNHESDRALEQRKEYIKEWKKDLIREKVWISFSKEEHQTMKRKLRAYMLKRRVTKKKIKLSEEEVDRFIAHLEPDNTDGETFEYHVDKSSYFQELGNAMHPDGATFSKFAPTPTEDPDTWPLLVVGQDEATFKSMTFKKRIWAQDDLVPLFPKSQGQGLMVSGFFARHCGFHFEVTNEQLAKINANREGKTYSMQVVAKEERKQRIDSANCQRKNKVPVPTGPVMKEPLTRENLPWVRFLNIGVNREGFFTWEKFYIQIEDLMDCLEVMYPRHQICFEMDWSGCHGKKAGDSPNVNNMNLRPSKNMAKGNFRDSVLSPETLGDNPAYEHLSEKIIDGKKSYVQHYRFREGEKPLFECKDQDYTGWCKGMKQILMERGLWKSEMKLNPPKRDDAIRQDLSAKWVLGSCHDFACAKTLLEELIEARGPHFKMRKTPICHPELAGKGVEYAWGDSKKTYRRMPERLSNLKLANKHQLRHVRQSLSRVSREKSRRYAGKTYEYKRTYASAFGQAMTHVEIETSAKKMKQHRDCGRLHAAFISEVVEALAHTVLYHVCTCSLCI